jgi:6-phosphogluconolactonase
MATHCFLENVAIPEAHVFTMPAELGPEIGAKEYREIVINALPFDMVLLGMGEDGHTASLFPGHQHKQDELVHAVYNSPKPPSERMSISAEALSSTHQLIIMVTGANKQDAVNAWRSGQDLPVATINPKNTIDIYIDKDAFKS